MADWRVVTPQRVPTEDELGEAVVSGSFWLVFQCQSAVDIQYHIRAEGKEYLRVRLLYKEPAEIYDYSFAENRWQDAESSPIDITTVDLTIPESAVSSATIKTPYFDLIAYEKGTTACKLAVAIEAKTLIRNALSSRGINVSDDIAFRKYAGMVEQIGGGTCMVTVRSVAGLIGYYIDAEGNNAILRIIPNQDNSAEIRKGSYLVLRVGEASFLTDYSGDCSEVLCESPFDIYHVYGDCNIRIEGDEEPPL